MESGIKQREQQISELTGAVRGKEEQIRHFDEQIADISSQLKKRDIQIDELNITVQGKDAEMRDLKNQIAIIFGQHNAKGQQIYELNAAIQGKDARIVDLEGQLAELFDLFDGKELQISELNGAIHNKDAQILDFKGQIADISDQLAEKGQQIYELNVAVQDKDAQIPNLEGQITNNSRQLRDKEERIRDFEMKNLRINSELNSIKSSLTWRTVMRLHSFVEKSMPPMTGRRRYYDLGIIGLRTITNEGWRSFWWNFKEYNRNVVRSRAKSQIVTPAFEGIPEHPEECQQDTNFKKYASKTFIQTSEYNITTDREEIKKKIEAIIEEIGKER